MLSRDLWMRVKPSSIKLILKCQEHLHFIKSQQNNYTFVKRRYSCEGVQITNLHYLYWRQGAGLAPTAFNENSSATVISQLKTRSAYNARSPARAAVFISLCSQESFDLGPSEFDV